MIFGKHIMFELVRRCFVHNKDSKEFVHTIFTEANACGHKAIDVIFNCDMSSSASADLESKDVLPNGEAAPTVMPSQKGGSHAVKAAALIKRRQSMARIKSAGGGIALENLTWIMDVRNIVFSVYSHDTIKNDSEAADLAVGCVVASSMKFGFSSTGDGKIGLDIGWPKTERVREWSKLRWQIESESYATHISDGETNAKVLAAKFVQALSGGCSSSGTYGTLPAPTMYFLQASSVHEVTVFLKANNIISTASFAMSMMHPLFQNWSRHHIFSWTSVMFLWTWTTSCMRAVNRRVL